MAGRRRLAKEAVGQAFSLEMGPSAAWHLDARLPPPLIKTACFTPVCAAGPGSHISAAAFSRLHGRHKPDGQVVVVSYNYSFYITEFLITNAVDRRRSRVFSGVCLSVHMSLSGWLSVSLHDISKTAAARATKTDTEMFQNESWKPIYFGVKDQRHESQKHRRRGSLHSCGWWLLVVALLLFCACVV